MSPVDSKIGVYSIFKFALQDATYEQLFTACDTRASEKGPAVHVSVWGEHCTMSVHDVSQLPLKDFCSLWTEYVRKLTQYLLQVGQLSKSNTCLCIGLTCHQTSHSSLCHSQIIEQVVDDHGLIQRWLLVAALRLQ